MKPKRPNPPNAAEPPATVRRTVEMQVDLGGWIQWYSVVSGKAIAAIIDEAHREYIQRHKDDYAGAPTITSTPIAQVFAARARK